MATVGTLRQFGVCVRGLLSRDDGQDVAEYALLCAFIALGSVAVWNLIEQALEAAYTEYDAAQQDLWEPDDPL